MNLGLETDIVFQITSSKFIILPETFFCIQDEVSESGNTIISEVQYSTRPKISVEQRENCKRNVLVLKKNQKKKQTFHLDMEFG